MPDTPSTPLYVYHLNLPLPPQDITPPHFLSQAHSSRLLILPPPFLSDGLSFNELSDLLANNKPCKLDITNFLHSLSSEK